MSVTPSSTVVGVFRDRSAAEQAIDALYAAGFGHEQIQYSAPGASGSFLEGLKSFFTGTSGADGNLATDLTNMGLSDEDARYYANEYNNGNTILAVRAAGREMEAMNVLHQYGGYNAQTTSGSLDQSTVDTQQLSNTTQQDEPTEQYNDTNTPTWATQSAQQQSQTTDPYSAHASDDGISGHDVASQNAQTIEASPAYDINAQAFQSSQSPESSQSPQPLQSAQPLQSSLPDTGMNQLSPETSTSSEVVTPQDSGDYQTANVTDAAPEPSTMEQPVQNAPSEYVSMPSDVQPYTAVSEQSPVDQTPQAYAPVQEQGTDTSTASSTASSATTLDASPVSASDDTQSQMSQSMPATSEPPVEASPSSASTISSEPPDELTQLQMQIQSLQQQLQEAKVQLQAAKEQETQLQAARARRQQLQAARQQVQDMQAELQATLSELQETQSRMNQYQQNDM